MFGMTLKTIHRKALGVAERQLEPGEEFRASGLTLTGPSPYWWLLLRLTAWLNKQYLVAVTDRRVLFVKTGKSSGRISEEVERADSLADVEILSGGHSFLWSHLRYRGPDGKVIRMNFRRAKRDEMEAIWDAMGRKQEAGALQAVGTR